MYGPPSGPAGSRVSRMRQGVMGTKRSAPGEACVAVERQDLDEILGNLIENAAKYGGGSVFVTVDAVPLDRACCEVWVEDDGVGIPQAARGQIFDRGARLD